MYDLTGFLSAAFVVLSLSGIALQLRTVLRRKLAFESGELLGERPTSVLSLNRFLTSYIAVFALAFYGLTDPNFNYYLVAPRVIAAILQLLILREMWLDRRNWSSSVTYWFALLLFVGSGALVFFDFRTVFYSSYVAHAAIVTAMILLGQGGAHQIYRIRVSGRTGALSESMHVLFLLKDVFSLAFACAMGVDRGWPVFAIHLLSLAVQVATLWQFRWVRSSPIAAQRRLGEVGG